MDTRETMAKAVRAIFSRFARWVLLPDLHAYQERLDMMSVLYSKAYVKIAEMSRRRHELLEWLDSRPVDAASENEVRFLRDYFLDGPMGPHANTNGVHPADRWNIQSFKRRS